jgi:XapX domain-containing protein
MKALVGIVLAFVLGFACRAFGIPLPAPPMILGALLVMTMTIGYLAVDRWASSPAKHARDCGGPSGLTLSQTPDESVEV